MLAVAAVLVPSVAACNSAADEPPGIQMGGTLRVVATSMPSNLDPQRIGAAYDANVSRLISRTLTAVKAEPGPAGSELAADLATDLGRPTDGNRVWEFRLRDGLKWADGTAVVCAHLKYGAERNFSTAAKETGLGYARSYLEGGDKYQGPFVGTNNGLASVECIDTKTIRYHLGKPVGDFNYTVSLPIFAPVKPGADSDDAAFDQAPLSNGPYMIKPGSRTKTEMILVRNEHWDRSTDKVRKAYPDQIIITADIEVPALTNRLIEDQGEARDTVMLTSDVSPNFVQQVMTDASLLERTAVGPSGAVRYVNINTKLIPNEKCRQALAFAFNKRKFRQAMGGSLLGELATTMIPPNLKAHQKFDHYDTLTNGGNGDPEKAKALIERAKTEDGVDCPKKIIVAHQNSPTTVNRFVKTLVEAYLEIGVQVELRPVEIAEYFGGWLGRYEAHEEIHMSYIGWIPDWPNGSTVIPPLFSSDEVATEPGEIKGNNYSYLQDPAVDQAIEEAMEESIIERQWKLWAELDSQINLKAATIPVIYSNSIRLHGSNVGGAFIHSAFAMPDLAAMGLYNPTGTP